MLTKEIAMLKKYIVYGYVTIADRFNSEMGESLHLMADSPESASNKWKYLMLEKYHSKYLKSTVDICEVAE